MNKQFPENLNEMIRRKTMALRTKCRVADPAKPRFVGVDNYNFKNHLYKRLRVMLRSNGCSVPTCTMCPFPNEALDPSIVKISTDQYLQQVKTTLSKYNNYEIISIYNDGSFFSEYELPSKARQEIYTAIRESNCKYLMVESLPFFITKERLQEAQLFLGSDIRLIVGIGLQSVSDIIRKVCIRTLVTKDDFLCAHKLLDEFGYYTKSYIIVKPPFVLEEEAILDAIESTVWLHKNNVKDITLCPMRIAKGTVLQNLFEHHLYSLPTLAVFSECLYQLQLQKIHARVSIFNVESSDFPALVLHGCTNCENKMLDGLLAYNNLQEVDFAKLRCNDCLLIGKKNDPVIFNGLPYIERIRIWLNISENKNIKPMPTNIQTEENRQNSIIYSNIQKWTALANSNSTSSFPIEKLELKKIFNKGDRILDYGCGQGRCIEFLNKEGFRSVVGCDPSLQMCETARKLNPLNDIIWLPEPNSIWFQENSFDGLLLIAVLSSVIPNIERQILMQNLRKLLKHHGKIVIGDFGCSQEPLYKKRYKNITFEPYTFKTEDNIWIHHFNEAELKELIRGLFKLNDLRIVDATSIHGRKLSAYILTATAI